MISAFQNEYRFLSNFWPATVRLDGVEYPTVEHAYAAAKTTSAFLRSQVQLLRTPAEAKKLGRNFTLRAGWDDMRLQVMEDLLRQKFADPDLKAKLVATSPHELVEGNQYGDVWWGQCNGKGENHLGRLLMKIRNEYAPVDLMPEF